jgi:hypothetical protein
MNNTIKSYDDFLEEKERMKNLLVLQKKHLQDNWEEFKIELHPVNNVFHVLGQMTKRDKTNPLLNLGINLVGDILLNKILLSRAGWITRLAVPFVVKNYSSHILGKKGRSLISKVGQIFKKKSISDNGYELPANGSTAGSRQN